MTAASCKFATRDSHDAAAAGRQPSTRLRALPAQPAKPTLGSRRYEQHVCGHTVQRLTPRFQLTAARQRNRRSGCRGAGAAGGLAPARC
jgi:hypothetical protein